MKKHTMRDPKHKREEFSGELEPFLVTVELCDESSLFENDLIGKRRMGAES